MRASILRLSRTALTVALFPIASQAQAGNATSSQGKQSPSQSDKLSIDRGRPNAGHGEGKSAPPYSTKTPKRHIFDPDKQFSSAAKGNSANGLTAKPPK